MENKGSFVDWSAGWVIDEGEPLWRLTIEFEEDGVKGARTRIDCIPSPTLMAHLNRRADQGLPEVAEALVRDLVLQAVNQVQYQLLPLEGTVENHIFLDDRDGKTALVRVVSTRIPPHDGHEKVLYLKEVLRIISHLNKEAFKALSPTQRKRITTFAKKELLKEKEKLTPHEPIPLILSTGDPIHFYADESGDVGFKEGSSDLYTVAFIEVAASVKLAVDARLRGILRDHMPGGKTEVKFGDVDRYADARKDAIYRESLATLREFRMLLYAFAVHKDGFVLEKVRSRMALYYYGQGSLPDLTGPFAAERVKTYSKEMLRSWGAATLPSVMLGRMIKEGREGRIFYDRAQWTWKNELIKEGFEETLRMAPRAAEVFFGVRCDVTMPLHLVDSDQEPCLWLAELGAREVNKHLLGLPSHIDEIAPFFAGAGPFRDGHFIGLVDEKGRYTYYDLTEKRVALVLPD